MGKRLEGLLEQEKQLKEKIKKLQAREEATKRKEDTRRKVLIGAAILAKVESEACKEWTEADLKALMGEFLTRSNDRRLFGLPLEPSKPASKEPKK